MGLLKCPLVFSQQRPCLQKTASRLPYRELLPLRGFAPGTPSGLGCLSSDSWEPVSIPSSLRVNRELLALDLPGARLEAKEKLASLRFQSCHLGGKQIEGLGWECADGALD